MLPDIQIRGVYNNAHRRLMHISKICRSLFSWIRSLESMVASACHDSASEIRKCNKSQRLPDIDRVVTLCPNSVAAWRLHCVIAFWNLNLLNYHTNTTDLHQFIFKKAPLFCITMLSKAIFYELSSKHDLPRLMSHVARVTCQPEPQLGSAFIWTCFRMLPWLWLPSQSRHTGQKP